MKVLAFAVAVVLLAVPAQAQGPSDSRWAPWLGCWELIGETVREADDAAISPRGQSGAASQRQGQETRPQVCAAPGQQGVTFTTTIAGETALEQTVVANGVDLPVDDAECQGTQRAEWSSDGFRLYSAAQITCAGDQTPRRVSGLALLAPDGTWLDIQAVEIGGREDVRLRRYRRVTEPAATTVPAVRATRLTIDDIREASSKVSPRALEAALVETNAAFDLSGRTLLDLDDAGVPESVIDVMVALSYPDRFVVERTRGARSGGGSVFLNDPFWLDYGFYSPLYGSSYYPYYYSPFAYSYYGRFDPRFFGGGIIVVPGTAPGGGDAPEVQPSGDARAVDGRGYTRVRPRQPEDSPAPASSGASSVRRVPPSTASTSSSSDGGSSSGSSSSGSSGASPQGFSSGGSSGDTGRTAVPR